MSGQVYGKAGVGVATGTWVANAGVARAGVKGELMTARELNRLVSTSDVTVLHDLMIPLQGITANIDHVVVSGKSVWLIDSKMWAPGFMWTMNGQTRRGTKLFPSADKQTMVMARQSIERFLKGTGAHIRTPLVVVWSTRHEEGNLAFLRMRGARTVRATRLLSILPADGKEADTKIVNQLRRLMYVPAKAA